MQELDGGTPSANLLTGLNIDEYFRRTDNDGSRDFLTDALGTILALTDSTGTVQTSYTYEPFGNTAQTEATSANAFQYTGRENDGTGLYYYRARYYNPTLQRFISSDPIGLEGGLNTYAYVENNPLLFIDPFGLEPNQCKEGKCNPKSPDFKKPCYRQCSNQGDCYVCCGAKGEKWCVGKPFSKECQRWGSWGKIACEASCSGGEPPPPPRGFPDLPIP